MELGSSASNRTRWAVAAPAAGTRILLNPHDDSTMAWFFTDTVSRVVALAGKPRVQSCARRSCTLLSPAAGAGSHKPCRIPLFWAKSGSSATMYPPFGTGSDTSLQYIGCGGVGGGRNTQSATQTRLAFGDTCSAGAPATDGFSTSLRTTTGPAGNTRPPSDSISSEVCIVAPSQPSSTSSRQPSN
eukprot:TRINITY_DN21253_c0_g1_i1.p2 TRINITY_DN21253_c0_g1~~TRINITY_DN21253_c0_g1_i1.p2  ORF type:complete len:186 (-),score=7.36 TRINITY_DN21253_c0_g1_i1:696-1253(-)